MSSLGGEAPQQQGGRAARNDDEISSSSSRSSSTRTSNGARGRGGGSGSSNNKSNRIGRLLSNMFGRKRLRSPSAPLLDVFEPAKKEAKLASSDSAATGVTRDSGAGVPGNSESLKLHASLQQRRPLNVIKRILFWDPTSVARKSSEGCMPLHIAAALAESAEVIQLLIDKCPKALEERDNFGRMPLHYAAAQSDKVEVVQLLIDKFPKALTERANEGWMPLHFAAAFNESIEVVQLLINKCPQAKEARTIHGALPMHMAAAGNKSVEVVQLLVNECPKALDDRDDSGLTPLHYAAQHAKSVEVVRLLIDKSPKVLEERDGVGGTLLHHAAAANESVELVQLLVKECPKALEEWNNWGMMPVHVAAKHSKSEAVVRLLIDKCPQALEERDNFGRIPLHYAAAENESVEVVQLLIDKSPKALDEADDEGWTPLHFAAQFARSVEVVQALVGKCPDASTHADMDGHRPVDLARLRGDEKLEEIASLLENATLLQEQAAGRRDHELDVLPPTKLSIAAAPPFAADPHQQDRDRIRTVLEDSSCGPVAVSGAYVQSILTADFLGKGLFGTVYKGVDSILGREFLIKSIGTESFRGGSPQDIEAAMKAFRKEQEALSRYRHPNIAALFAYTDPLAEQRGVAGGCHLVYELAEKGSLEKFLSNDLGRSRLGSFIRRVQIAFDVFTAIRFLHEGRGNVASCFHKDIKSANIVLKRNFTAQLIDCGIAKFVRDDVISSTSTGVKGTPGYICPEYAAGGIPYEAACDVYSFGVVLAELWTGRLQNYKDESGSVFNFDKNYIRGRKGTRRDVLNDVDPALGCEFRLPDYMTKFASLALSCMAHDIEDRPTGQEVLGELRSTLEACSNCVGSSESPNRGMNSQSMSIETTTQHCTTCRTFLSVRGYDLCLMCIVADDTRKAISAIQGDGSNPSAATNRFSNKTDDSGKASETSMLGLSKQVEVVDRKVNCALSVLAHIDMRLNNRVPRLLLMVPADLKCGWKHPRSWLRSTVQKTYYLYFVCAVSLQAVSPPIQLNVAKDWVKKVAPVLATALYLLQVSVKAGLNVNLALDGAASDLFHVSSSHIAETLREVVSLLDEAPDSRGLLDRLKAQRLSDQDVKELSGEAYELVIEKASEQHGWRSHMEPVRAPTSPEVFWVSNEVAYDPMFGYEIVSISPASGLPSYTNFPKVGCSLVHSELAPLGDRLQLRQDHASAAAAAAARPVLSFMIGETDDGRDAVLALAAPPDDGVGNALGPEDGAILDYPFSGDHEANYGSTSTAVTVRTDNDCVLGSLGQSTEIRGTRQFWEVANQYREMYQARSAAEKEVLAQDIVRSWRSTGGRFLRQGKALPHCSWVVAQDSDAVAMFHLFMCGKWVITPDFQRDFLFGRGGETNNHVGSIRFREKMGAVRFTYISSEIPAYKKKHVLEGVISGWREQGGRFLRRDKTIGLWCEADGSDVLTMVQTFLSRDREQHRARHQQCLLDRVILSSPSGQGPSNSSAQGAQPSSTSCQVSVASLETSPRHSVFDTADDMPVSFKGHSATDCSINFNALTLETTHSSDETVKIQSVSKSDVLFGKRGEATTHDGNVKYREFVAKWKSDYRASKGDFAHQETIVATIIQSVQPGRFLEYDSNEGSWIEARPSRVRDKLKRDLRDPSRSDGTVDTGEECSEETGDFLLGRGGATNSHRGNVLMRELVLETRSSFKECAVEEKDEFVQKVIDRWRETTGGRFLRPTNVSGKWVEVSFNEAKAVVRKLFTRSLKEGGAARALMNLRQEAAAASPLIKDERFV